MHHGENEEPHLGRWMADCVICFLSLLAALTYFNFRDGHFYHSHFGGVYAALLSASAFVCSLVDLLRTFRRAERWRKDQVRRSL